MEFQNVINMRRGTVRLEREGNYWEEDEKEFLAELFNEGVGITQIASLLQRTEPAIMQQIEHMDLYERKQYPKRRRSLIKRAGCLCKRCSQYLTCQCSPERCPKFEEE